MVRESYISFSPALVNYDVIKWKHFPRYWPFVRRINRSPVNPPHKGQWRGDLVFSLICAWINAWVSNRQAGDLGRYRVHYDVIVMSIWADVLAVMNYQSWTIYGISTVEIRCWNVKLTDIHLFRCVIILLLFEIVWNDITMIVIFVIRHTPRLLYRFTGRHLFSFYCNIVYEDPLECSFPT